MSKDQQIKKILGYILEGLSEQEAALLSGISWEELEALKKRSPSLVDILEKKKVEFKRSHLINISKKNDPKTSQWILEKLRPEEFGTKKVAETPANIFAVLIKEIQKSDDKFIPEPKRIETESSGPHITVEEILK